METVGFVGFGVMGKPMAANLVKAGLGVIGYDIAADSVRAVPGVTTAASLRELAEKVDRVVTMLPDSPHVETVVAGEGGLLQYLRPGAIIADMSTISPKVSQRLNRQAAELNIGMLDAPVSGGMKGAVAGALSIMVGGSREDFDAFRRIFSCMGGTIELVGPSGCGQTVKLCNQTIVAINIQAICEAFSLARAEGLDLETARKVLMGGAANSWMLENLAPQMIAGDASAGFRIALQLKDLRLAQETAFHDGVAMPGLALATAMYLETAAHGETDNGNQAMYRAYERLNNRDFR